MKKILIIISCLVAIECIKIEAAKQQTLGSFTKADADAIISQELSSEDLNEKEIGEFLKFAYDDVTKAPSKLQQEVMQIQRNTACAEVVRARRQLARCRAEQRPGMPIKHSGSVMPHKGGGAAAAAGAGMGAHGGPMLPEDEDADLKEAIARSMHE